MTQNSGALIFYATSLGSCFTTFRRNVLPSFSRVKWTKKKLLPSQEGRQEVSNCTLQTNTRRILASCCAFVSCTLYKDSAGEAARLTQFSVTSVLASVTTISGRKAVGGVRLGLFNTFSSFLLASEWYHL